jgi:hypothetical protein
MFDKMSVKTMRYVSPIPRHKANGLVAQVYDMIAEDFFINGSLTSHSKVPELLAGVWIGGRESILVSDRLDRTTKEAMTATLSRFNACPYCGDMLISLVYGGGEHEAASQIFSESEDQIADATLRERLAWVKTVATRQPEQLRAPFTDGELPEAIGALFAMSHINRFSHVVMDGSPVTAPLGLQRIKSVALKMFGAELKVTTELEIEPGRAMDLLPAAPLPEDMKWAQSNPRIADAFSRWAAVIERQARTEVSPAVRESVSRSLNRWQGERMPLSRSWVEDELNGLEGNDRGIARLALVVAKASYQVDESLVEAVIGNERDERKLVRVLAWASFSAARRFAQCIAESASQPQGAGEQCKPVPVVS